MTIVRVRPPGFDQYGDPIAGTPNRLTLEGAFVAPRSTSDIDARGRQGVINGLTLFGEFGTDLVHTDQVEVDGVLYDIDGDAGQWKSPFTGWEAGCEVALVRAVG